MGDLEPITRNEKLWSGEDLTPVTRKEMYIKHLYDETQVIPEYPVTREEMFILKAGEELHDVTIEQLTATENKTYSEEGVAYSPVIVNVPLPENAYLLKDIPATPASIATFPDGSDLPMPKLEVAIEPVQDLHGYDAPWVGGAGKNKLENATSLGSRTINGVTITTREDGSLLFNGTSTGGVNFIINNNVQLPDNTYILSTDTTMPTNSIIAVNTSDGNKSTRDSVTFTGSVNGNVWIYVGQEGVVFNNLIIKPMIRLASVQDPTFAPYSNICPISGWDEVNVGVVGKNLLDANESYNVSADATWLNIGCDMPIGTYTFSYKASSENGQITFNVYNANNERILNIGGISNSDPKVTFTINERGARISSYSNSTLTISDLQIELDSTATTYEPYNGTTYTIDLNGTRYGGKVDLVSGVMTVDRVSLTVDENSNIISGSGGLPFRIDLLTGAKTSSSASALTGVKCNFLKEVTQSSSWGVDGTFSRVTTDAKIVYFKVDSEITTIQQLKTFLQSNNLQLVYELATPLTIQLTPTVVKSLRGMNNVWADCGNILDLSYLAKEE